MGIDQGRQEDIALTVLDRGLGNVPYLRGCSCRYDLIATNQQDPRLGFVK